MRHIVLYFAYGSNLDVGQMAYRCPDATVFRKALLHNYRFGFGGTSRRWRAAVATVLEAGGAKTEGLLYRVSEAEIATLDVYEDHPNTYQREWVDVVCERGEVHRAYCYIFRTTREAPPSDRYYEIVRGAYQHLGFEPSVLGPTPVADKTLFFIPSMAISSKMADLPAQSLGVVQTLVGYRQDNWNGEAVLVRHVEKAVQGQLFEVRGHDLLALDETFPPQIKRSLVRLTDGEVAWSYFIVDA